MLEAKSGNSIINLPKFYSRPERPSHLPGNYSISNESRKLIKLTGISHASNK